jgi:N-acetylglucosaminyldiphosphoundecaprenol N-acetyl-beta-D-mannosaminyltransferase
MSLTTTFPMRLISVLGTPLAATDYAGLEDCLNLLAEGHDLSCVDFANTHIVTMRRHDSVFREVTNAIDLFVPDGMPLVWCMNARGAGLRDRVYGPTFMRHMARRSSGRWRHYLLGGSESGSAALQSVIRAENPDFQIAGSYTGPCDASGTLGGSMEEHTRVVAEIVRAAPHFVWVGLGAPKQYHAIARLRTALPPCVLLAVGFAFDVNAGVKPDAPMWMQRRGLTWLFRMLSEPRRLVGRYLRWNTLFLYYLVKEELFRGRRAT